MLNIMITAGGTDEAIDDVRKITNTSTGRLAAAIQRAWLAFSKETGQALTIHYIAAEGAVMPESLASTHVHRITDTFSLQEKVRQILENHQIHVIIHLMAVSDYYVADVMSMDDLADCLAHYLYERSLGDERVSPEIIREFFLGNEDRGGKISGKLSSNADLMLQLKKTPKIIREMKEISPDSILVGFKLLSNVEEDELVRVAERQRLSCGCEFVVANDKAHIHGDSHRAVFVKDGLVFERCETKEEIAEKLVKELTS